MNDAFQLPDLFVIACIACGAALLCAPFLWIGYGARRGLALYRVASGAFFSALALVAFGSFLNGVFAAHHVLKTEIFIFAFCLLLIWLVHRRQGVKMFMLYNCSIIVIVTILMSILGFVWGVFTVLNFVDFGFIEPLRESVLIVGALYMLVLWKVFQKTRMKAAEGMLFRQMLWPIALGLLVWMMPLMVMNFVHSEKYHKMRDYAPRLQKV